MLKWKALCTVRSVAAIQLRNCLITNERIIHTTSPSNTFWEREKGSGYKGKSQLPFKSKKEQILEGLKELKSEISLWKDEMRDKIECDPLFAFRPGETDVVWSFGKKEDLEKFVVTADRDFNEGHSHANFEIGSAGYGYFNGFVDSRVPKDGKVKRSGYCNVKSIRAMKSFKRETYLNWALYNILVMRVRGDGRPYLLNIACEGYFDIMWNDVYHYVLYTRGGPHWQNVKIPFSKFFLASKGRVQDKQYPIPLEKITNFGITVGAKFGQEGPFGLEIDFIGLEFDPNHTEKFAYEMYKMPKYMVGV